MAWAESRERCIPELFWRTWEWGIFLELEVFLSLFGGRVLSRAQKKGESKKDGSMARVDVGVDEQGGTGGAALGGTVVAWRRTHGGVVETGGGVTKDGRQCAAMSRWNQEKGVQTMCRRVW
ncbi:hypothetical protein B0H19DRAFT_1079950 [Mycena capillaripes]|nr:hypothetical protein B0H19DRAFT_1079950 [Mycena capillaripes]